MAVVLITHDLGVVAEIADRVAVMYAGRGRRDRRRHGRLRPPAEEYTRASAGRHPAIGAGMTTGVGATRTERPKLLELTDLRKEFGGRRGSVAVDDVSLTCMRARRSALVGESGWARPP